ncbi:MAG: ATP-binding cassette domain-containing protein [Bacteroidetes bacterium]|nr:ATP-binding cassette domain-containing protein [Bacteroidota bacterium]
MIKFSNIKKSFGNKTILKGISGSFDNGVVNLVVGASGTGKSVLMKCVVGLIQADHGKILFDNKELFKKDSESLNNIRRQTGMLFQGGALFDSMNVEENVRFPLDILTDKPLKEKIERANFCLKKVGLENIGKKRISELSGGMQKRVGIARAIVNKPKYLFFDEPNSGLDPQTALMIDELIKEITHEYNTITVVVTHDINSMLTIGEHIMFLYKGKKTWDGSSEEIFNSDSETFNDFFFSSEMAKIIRKKFRKNVLKNNKP